MARRKRVTKKVLAKDVLPAELPVGAVSDPVADEMVEDVPGVMDDTLLAENVPPVDNGPVFGGPEPEVGYIDEGDNYSFPEYGITIKAHSIKEAKEKLMQVLAKNV